IEGNQKIEYLKHNEEYRKLIYIAEARGQIKMAESILNSSELQEAYDHLIVKMKRDLNEILDSEPPPSLSDVRGALKQIDRSVLELKAKSYLVRANSIIEASNLKETHDHIVEQMRRDLLELLGKNPSDQALRDISKQFSAKVRELAQEPVNTKNPTVAGHFKVEEGAEHKTEP